MPVTRELLDLLCGDVTCTELVERDIGGQQLVNCVSCHADGVLPVSDGTASGGRKVEKEALISEALRLLGRLLAERCGDERGLGSGVGISVMPKPACELALQLGVFTSSPRIRPEAVAKGQLMAEAA